MKADTRVRTYWGGAIALCLFIGYLIGHAENFQFFKLLNLVGLIYDFLAVILLTYVILAKNEIQDVLAHHISLAFIAFSTVFPASVQLGSFVGGRGFIMNGGMMAFIIISLVPIVYTYSSPVLEPTFDKRFSPEKRIKILGIIFLLMGFAFQIISSIIDTFLLIG